MQVIKNQTEQQTSPPGGSENSDLLALLKALFVWYISQNWALRLLPVVLGFVFYNYIESHAILLILWIQCGTEVLHALNVFLYNSNITIIQLHFLKQNTKTLFGIHDMPLQARKPDDDYSSNTSNKTSNSNKAILSGSFLQEKINKRLAASGEGAAHESEKEDKTVMAAQPYKVEFSRKEQGKLWFWVDEKEWTRDGLSNRLSLNQGRNRSKTSETSLRNINYFTLALNRLDELIAERKAHKTDETPFEVTNKEIVDKKTKT